MKNKSSVMKGIGIGMAVGGIAGMVGSAMMGKPARRQSKKNVAKAMRTIGDMMDSIRGMID